MRNQIIFAIIGASLSMLNSMWWIIIKIIGYENISPTIMKIMSNVSDGAWIVTHMSLIVFFVSLLNRQKMKNLMDW